VKNDATLLFVCRHGGEFAWQCFALNDKIGSASIYSFTQKFSVRKPVTLPCM